MAYKDFETSLFRGRPIELYRFEYGGDVYRYTSHNKDFTYNDATYKSIPLRRGSIRRMKDSVAENYLTIEIDKTSPVADKFRIIAPAKTLWISVYRLHRNDPDKEVVTLFTGRVRGVDFAKPLAELKCDSLGSALKRAGLRMNYQTMCNHMQYSSRCGIDRNAYRVVAQVDNTKNEHITSTALGAFKDGWFKLGYVEYQGYYYMIIDHIGSTITLLNAPEGLKVYDEIQVYAGCDRTLDTCWDKFSNGLNFGGCPFIPGENPFRWGL